MILSDRTIRKELDAGRIVIDPLERGFIQPASVDLRLDRRIRTFPSAEKYSFIDVKTDLSELTKLEEIPELQPFVLGPKQFILASTLEYIEIPDDIVARLEGKSSLGRLGLLVHATAGYVDPGFKGQLTLEISNVAQANIALYRGMKISQLSFLQLSTPAEFPYGSPELSSKYQGQEGPVATRFHLEYQRSAREERPYPGEQTELKRWLDSSDYSGSTRKLAKVLGAEFKTVEEWVYGRHKPSGTNKTKLYEVTGLAVYAPEPGARQAGLFPPDSQPEISPLLRREG